MDSTTAGDIEDKVREIVEEIAPDARFVPKYGGHVIAPDPDDDTHFVGGVFAYAEHVSLEFSQGADFDDPDGRLEGGGKRRRHLKLRSVEDVRKKGAEGFLRRALDG